MTVEALVRPDLLVWARESAGFTLAEAAKKAQVKAESLVLWESGLTHPSIPQLRKLANVYKRPLAVFYLPEPPRGFAAMRDFRRLPGEVAGRQSPELRRAIRQVEMRREVTTELYKDLEGDPPAFPLSATLKENPEDVGVRVRNTLGISYARQTRWDTDYAAFNDWRSAVEATGAVVFQVRDVSPQEMRGFSLNGKDPFPAIALNISDPVRARVFTLAHETVHLALHDAGLCDLDEEHERPPEELQTEVFCNHAAGAALVPRTQLLVEPEVRDQHGLTAWHDGVIDALATRYRASREVVMRRLLILGRTTPDFYKKKRAQYAKEYLAFVAAQKAKAKEQEGGGFAPPDRLALSTAGPLFTRLVLEGYDREIITSSDVADYLDIRLKHLPKIDRAIARSR